MTQNDPVEPGATAPGSTPESAVITGDARVDQALGRLGELGDRPLAEHAAVFEHIHGELTGALGTLDSGNDQFPQAPIAPAQNPPAQIQPAQIQPAQIQPAQIQPAQIQPAQIPRAAAAHGTPATPDS